MSIERAVALLTPLFAAFAAWLTGLIAAHVPGVHIPPDQIVALMVTGATAAAAAALKWLHGRSQWTDLQADADQLRSELARIRGNVVRSPAGPALAEIESLLKAHEAEVVATIDEHIPAAMSRVLDLLLARLSADVAAEVAPTPVVAPVSDATPPTAEPLAPVDTPLPPDPPTAA